MRKGKNDCKKIRFATDDISHAACFTRARENLFLSLNGDRKNGTRRVVTKKLTLVK
jgi:hypothetical protein